MEIGALRLRIHTSDPDCNFIQRTIPLNSRSQWPWRQQLDLAVERAAYNDSCVSHHRSNISAVALIFTRSAVPKMPCMSVMALVYS